MKRPGRHVEGARTRERVLEAAATLIAKQGYAATSIGQISKLAGANPASIYWAFENKERLFAAVMERAADRFYRQFDSMEAYRDPWAALAQLAEAFRGGPEFLRLLLVLSLERRDGDPQVIETARRVRIEGVRRLAELFVPAIDVDDVQERDRIAIDLARFTIMLNDGAFIASQIEPETTDLDAAFELIAECVKTTAERFVAESRERGRAPRSAPPLG